MYGSVFQMRPKAGMAQQLRETMMNSDRRPPGMVTAYLLSEGGDGAVWGLAVFESEAKYRANAADPGQDEQYRTFRALLESDPEWHDGEIQQRAD